MPKSIYLLVLILSLTLDELSLAEDDSAIQVSGFGSLFATHAGNEKLGYYHEYTNLSQTGDWALTTDSNLGLQLDAKLSPQLSATVQTVFKDRVKNGVDENIDWANLKYQPNSNVALRVGRMALGVHMLSEYRDVGYAYLWVRPITEFYSPVVFSHFDGIDATYEIPLQSGTIQYKLLAGLSNADLIEANVKAHSETEVFGASIL